MRGEDLPRATFAKTIESIVEPLFSPAHFPAQGTSSAVWHRGTGSEHEDSYGTFKKLIRNFEPDWKVCLAWLISPPGTLNFSCGSSREIFVKQQKETIELSFSDTNAAAQAIRTKERSPAHSANFPIWTLSTEDLMILRNFQYWPKVLVSYLKLHMQSWQQVQLFIQLIPKVSKD